MFLFSDKEDDIIDEDEDKDVETAQEKRLRLAKQYLAELESEGKCLIIVNCLRYQNIHALKYSASNYCSDVACSGTHHCSIHFSQSCCEIMLLWSILRGCALESLVFVKDASMTVTGIAL